MSPLLSPLLITLPCACIWHRHCRHHHHHSRATMFFCRCAIDAASISTAATTTTTHALLCSSVGVLSMRRTFPVGVCAGAHRRAKEELGRRCERRTAVVVVVVVASGRCC
jgi:hypothetical protein